MHAPHSFLNILFYNVRTDKHLEYSWVGCKSPLLPKFQLSSVLLLMKMRSTLASILELEQSLHFIAQCFPDMISLFLQPVCSLYLAVPCYMKNASTCLRPIIG